MSGVIALVIANIIWGAAPPIFKYALTDIPPFTLGFIRFFFAALILLPFIWKKNLHFKKRYWFHIIMGGIWGISLNVSLFFLGLQLAPSINVHIIGSLGPIVLYILSLIILKEKPHPQLMKGMIISVVGAALIVLAPLFRSGFSQQSEFAVSSQILGNVFFIISMLGAALTVIHTKKVADKVDPITITTIQFVVGVITFFPLMLPELKTWSIESLNTHSWVGIIYGVFFSSAIAYFTHNYAIKKLPAQQIAVYSYMMPVIAVLVAIPLLNEYPDIYFIIGSVFVLIGMFISERHPHLHKMHKKLHEK